MPVKQSLGGNPKFASNSRATIFKALIIVISLLYTGRLAMLQIIEGNIYREVSENQAIKKISVEPFRGNMYDRNGKLIVHNEPSFTITLTPNDFKLESLPLLLSIIPADTLEIISALSSLYNNKQFNSQVLPTISEMLNIGKSKISKRPRNVGFYSRFSPVKIYRDAQFSEISKIEEFSDFLPGVDILVESKRLYEFDGKMAHIMGYTREISPSELKRKSYYRPGDYIGKRGLERTYEDLLRGNPGVQFVAVNSAGQKISVFDKGKNDVPAQNGFDLYLSIDARLQEEAEKQLEGKVGAVVAIEPATGEIMVLASSPDFDPRDFAGKIPRGLFTSLYSNPDKPMYNRAVQSSNPPGSTWKMLMAIAALQEGLIDEHTTFYCAGGMHYGGRFPKCHGAHGNISVRRAIQTSCNVFFYNLGLKLGMEKFEKYGKMFGFGQLSGLDLPGENKGLLPTMKWLKDNPRSGGFQKGKLLNYGIGQGEILTTPLQLAAYTATIANEGTYNQPHLVKSMRNLITNKIEPIEYQSRELPIEKKIFQIVKKGMYDVVNIPGGTAASARIPGKDVCGKTGTAQNPGVDHAWFVAFAPLEAPEIAICVFIENAGFGGTHAAPVAKKVFEKFFFPDSVKKPVMPDTTDFEQLLRQDTVINDDMTILN